MVVLSNESKRKETFALMQYASEEDGNIVRGTYQLITPISGRSSYSAQW
jgi:hypothetical protein